jgi:5'(3')-deoxyribonucleotidase
MKFFVDLDSVLTDFEKQLAELLDRPLERGWDFGNDPKVWAKISHAGEEFWTSMKWMPDGHELWDAVKKHDPTILSSPTRHPSSVEGKKKWLKENLPGVPYIIESKKEQYAEPGAVLIDDREKNIKKWEEAGGIGILHKDADSTIKKLDEIMSKEKNATVKTIEDPAGRRIVVDKPRMTEVFSPVQTRRTVMPPERGKGAPYKRSIEKKVDWDQRAAADRVTLFYLRDVLKGIQGHV